MSDHMQEEERVVDFSTLDLQNEVATPDTTWAIDFLTRKLQEAMANPALQGVVHTQLQERQITLLALEENSPSKSQHEASKRGNSNEQKKNSAATRRGRSSPREAKSRKKAKDTRKKSLVYDVDSRATSDSDMHPRKRQRAPSPSPSDGRRSSSSRSSRCSDKDDKKGEKKRRKKKPSNSPPSQSSFDSENSSSSDADSKKSRKRRVHRRTHAAWKWSSTLRRKFKEGGKSITFLSFDGTFGNVDKVLGFIQQFDAAFGDENFSESSKLQHVAMHLQKSARQWWASLRSKGEAPKTWKTCRVAIMKQFLSHGASDQVLTAWRSLKLEEGENMQRYVETFWDLHLKVLVYKRINFSEQKRQCCAGLPEEWRNYVNAQRPRTISEVIHHDMILSNSGVESPRTFLEVVIETINKLSGFLSLRGCRKLATQGEQAHNSTKMQALNQSGNVSSQSGLAESTGSRQNLKDCAFKGSFDFDDDLDYSKHSNESWTKQKSQTLTKKESVKDTSATEVDLQKTEYCENLVEDCLLSAVKVLMNLTNDNELGCRRVAIVGGLDAMASLIVRLFPSFHSFPSNLKGEVGETPQKVIKASETESKDQDMDLLVVVLGVLVNLVEKDTKNRGRLVSMNTEMFSSDSLTNVTCKEHGIIKLLCSIFLSKEGSGRAIESSKGNPVSEVDVESSLKQGQQEAEDMIVEAYSALLLAFLSKESSNVRSTIAQHLPEKNLGALVPVLERFLEFHLSLNMLSPETHDTVREVIESCK
ncbi:hypothetical protein L7F22_002812 [Adiantum nelumboides]|nr:hypothetical protein [Adiantum nelumboides]